MTNGVNDFGGDVVELGVNVGGGDVELDCLRGFTGEDEKLVSENAGGGGELERILNFVGAIDGALHEKRGSEVGEIPEIEFMRDDGIRLFAFNGLDCEAITAGLAGDLTIRDLISWHGEQFDNLLFDFWVIAFETLAGVIVDSDFLGIDGGEGSAHVRLVNRDAADGCRIGIEYPSRKSELQAVFFISSEIRDLDWPGPMLSVQPGRGTEGR